MNTLLSLLLWFLIFFILCLNICLNYGKVKITKENDQEKEITYEANKFLSFAVFTIISLIFAFILTCVASIFIVNWF